MQKRGGCGFKLTWGDARMRVYTFKAPESMMYMLDKVARKYKMTRSELIRELIRECISKELGNEKKKPIVIKRVVLSA